MKKVAINERPGWRQYAESVGFDFHTFDGEAYWDESAYYQFSLAQIEQDIEAPTEELHQMALSLVPDILADEQKLRLLEVPEQYWDWLAQSWRTAQPHLYGRLDLAYHGKGPAKLLELNYDTPTSLFETGFFQWVWLEDQMMRGQLPQGADQFNSLQDQLEQAFAAMPLRQPCYFSCVGDNIEDKGTVNYLLDLATQAGIDGRFLALEQLGEINGQLVDVDDFPVQAMFKLYPWEFMLREEFGQHLLTSDTQWLEPALENVVIQQRHTAAIVAKVPESPKPAAELFESPGEASLRAGWVRKPLYSREGANIELIDPQGNKLTVDGPYTDAGFIRQEFYALPKFDQSYTLIGSWLVGDSAAGIGIREDNSLITKDSSRFLPHIILD